MSIHSFVNNAMHFGKLGERRSETYGTIELYDIGEADSVGAFYSGDKSLQAHPLTWYDELVDALAKSAKKRGTAEQKLVMPVRPTLGRKPSLASELRRLSHIDTPWVKPVVAAGSGSGNGGDTATGGGRRAGTAKAPRKHRVVETVEIPKGAIEFLKAGVAQYGACKAIRLFVRANPMTNKTSVIASATAAGINKSTAGVQYANAVRDIAAGTAEPASRKEVIKPVKKSTAKAGKQVKPTSKATKRPAPIVNDPEAAFALGQLRQEAKAAKSKPKAKSKGKKK